MPAMCHSRTRLCVDWQAACSPTRAKGGTVAHIQVDGELFTCPTPTKTFEDILGVVEPALVARARIVTAVRFNGVEEPAFRESDVRGRTLGDDEHIEFGSARPVDIATAALHDAGRLIPAMSAAAAQLALQLLRSDEAADSAAGLGPLAEGLALLLALVQTAEDWANAAGVTHAPWLAAQVETISEAIDVMQAAQRAEDWVTVADALRFDLCPALEAWRAHLAAEYDALARAAQEPHA
jgi:hypothetical protein